MNFLLDDETSISDYDLKVREMLYKEFEDLPKDFTSKMRHFQPQVGCFNNCGFCSKFSVCKSEYWNEETIRNVISPLKMVAKKYTSGDILLAWDRQEHRIGVNFPYLDNDIGNYLFLDKFIELCYKELGVRTRISTVGFSRHNKELNRVHRDICSSDLVLALGGVRLSISQYGRVWEDSKDKVSLEDYEKDISNFLSIYKSYYNSIGPGSRKMCVEIRYNPLVEDTDVMVTKYNGYMVIYTNNYLFVSKEQNIKLVESHVANPYKHSLELSEEPKYFNEYNITDKINTEEDMFRFLDANFDTLVPVREMELYLFSNRDGIYYSLNPKITNEGNYGFNVYPKTNVRKKSGYLITERFLLNAIYEFKHRRGMNLRDIYQNSTWKDVYEVLDICNNIAINYEKEGKLDKSNYIKEHVLPIVTIYVHALEDAGYSSDCFFDSKFTIDTGTICNLGRANKLFKGLSNFVNEPLTPTHERNYGRYCSTMKQENYAWKLSCGFNNTIVIEKLDLFNTASQRGQTSFKKEIKLDKINEIITEEEDKYFYPGSKE